MKLIWTLSLLTLTVTAVRSPQFRRSAKCPFYRKFRMQIQAQLVAASTYILHPVQREMLSPTTAFVQLSHFSVPHGGFNNTKWHVSGSLHRQRQKDSYGTSAIATFFQKDATDHQCSVISVEVQMANFIAMHNLSFQTADHLSDLLLKMFPDLKIASDFGCKHTKVKLSHVTYHGITTRLDSYTMPCDLASDLPCCRCLGCVT